MAELLVDLLRSALNLSANEIRCTSVDGYRLPGGADVEEQLRNEILNVKTLIGLISSASFDSAYVLFEFGALWGSKKNLIPLLAPGTNTSILKGPIAGYNALSCYSNAQLQQLIIDVSLHVNEKVEHPNVYQKNIERILRIAARDISEGTSPLQIEKFQSIQDDDIEGAEEIIRRYCKEKWPDDFQMQAYCEDQQRAALEELKRGSPVVMSEGVPSYMS